MFSKENGPCSILSSVWVYLDFSRRISYRFRLVSISCDPSFVFSIDNHTMTVIEVDGTNAQPLLIDSLTIFAGARGSIQVSCSTNRCLKQVNATPLLYVHLIFLPYEGVSQLSVGQRQPTCGQLL